MSRVYQPDTLVSELRAIQRRLRLLEAGAPRAAAAMTASAVSRGEPFLPARPRDWPGTESAEWEPLLRAFAPPGRSGLVVETAADPGTAGRVRLLVDGVPLDVEWEAGDEVRREVVEVDVPGGAEVVVEGLRRTGDGAVRVVAFVLPRP
ncbi:MAG TPA: hypothetical protein VNO31_00660 [Umezawaea sp.]|nr:hypothetical protein [Umezawaea sp.]